MFTKIHYLRAFAAMSVVVYHIHSSFMTHLNIELLRIFSIGDIGVDIFFIISGFIMMHVSFNKEFDAVAFIKNRFFRIYPVYFFYFSVAFFIFLIFPDKINRNAPHEIKVLPSLLLLPYTEYSNLIPVAWTLVYEIHFYFIITVVFSIVEKLRTFILVSTLCLLSLSSIFTNSTYYTDFISNPIILEFAMGILLYSLTQKPIVYEDLLTSLILISTLLVVYVFSDSIRSIKYGMPSFLIIIFLLSLTSKNKDSKNIFEYFLDLAGTYSYSLYLSHIFVISAIINLIIFLEIKNINVYIIFFLTIILCNIIAFLSYRIIEQPLIRLLNNSKYRAKKRVTPLHISNTNPKSN